MTLDERSPVVVADAGPLIRLAAAGLLGSLRGLNRRIVLVDRVEDEVSADRTKPFADEIVAWIEAMGPAIERVRTVEGYGIAALRESADTPEAASLLKRRLRDSGERAIREFVEGFEPDDASAAIILYEDRDAPALMAAARVPLTLMTTRRFARLVNDWGINVDAVAAIEAITGRYDLKPSTMIEIEPASGSSAK
ncbi:hypothetical protein RUR49_02260 [Pseudoxanthobacter sp. M-2]|uniref:hypothetical protein n=1 Tax=Pseudoxanthobacter sp. M-2 TaxID=3078754 RepID=UPI0038FCA699